MCLPQLCCLQFNLSSLYLIRDGANNSTQHLLLFSGSLSLDHSETHKYHHMHCADCKLVSTTFAFLAEASSSNPLSRGVIVDDSGRANNSSSGIWNVDHSDGSVLAHGPAGEKRGEIGIPQVLDCCHIFADEIENVSLLRRERRGLNILPFSGALSSKYCQRTTHKCLANIQYSAKLNQHLCYSIHPDQPTEDKTMVRSNCLL